jgi:Fe2+ transport system protein FeoA
MSPNEGNWTFLGDIDQRLLALGFVPEDPLKKADF